MPDPLGLHPLRARDLRRQHLRPTGRGGPSGLISREHWPGLTRNPGRARDMARESQRIFEQQCSLDVLLPKIVAFGRSVAGRVTERPRLPRWPWRPSASTCSASWTGPTTRGGPGHRHGQTHRHIANSPHLGPGRHRVRTGPTVRRAPASRSPTVTAGTVPSDPAPCSRAMPHRLHRLSPPRCRMGAQSFSPRSQNRFAHRARCRGRARRPRAHHATRNLHLRPQLQR